MKKSFELPFDYTTWAWFDITWPWIGLGFAILILILLFATNFLRYNFQISRWRDAVWLSWFAVPIYMLHQFEEYGIDLLGRKHAFPTDLCNNLSLGNYPSCIIPHDYFLYVNISLVWFIAVLNAKFSSKNTFVGLGLYSVLISNAIVHLIGAVAAKNYNPGLFTAIVIFLPSFYWLCKALFGQGGFAKKGISILIATGVILHIILISSLVAFTNQKINGTTLNIIQLINATTIIVVPWLGDRFLKIRHKHMM